MKRYLVFFSFLLTLVFSLQSLSANAQSAVDGEGTVVLVTITDQAQMSSARSILGVQIPKTELKGYYTPKSAFITVVRSTSEADVKAAIATMEQKLAGCKTEKMSITAFNDAYNKSKGK